MCVAGPEKSACLQLFVSQRVPFGSAFELSLRTSQGCHEWFLEIFIVKLNKQPGTSAEATRCRNAITDYYL